MNSRKREQRKKDRRIDAQKKARNWRPSVTDTSDGLPSDDAMDLLLFDHLDACPDCGARGRVAVPCDEADRLAQKFGRSSVHSELPDSWELRADHKHLHCRACGSIGCVNPPQLVEHGGGHFVTVPEITWDAKSQQTIDAG